MKQFFTILKFELDNYFKSKSYVISTILIAVLAAGIMFVPRVKDAITGDKKDSTVQDSASKEDSSAEADASSSCKKIIFFLPLAKFCDLADMMGRMINFDSCEPFFFQIMNEMFGIFI